jgi:hypothetical protein
MYLPHRVLSSSAYRIRYPDIFPSSLSLNYDGMNMGYSSGYSASRYSYTFPGDIVRYYDSYDLLYIPASREALDKWNFTDYSDGLTGDVTYSSWDHRDHLWA